MAQQDHHFQNGGLQSPTLVNSYGMEAARTEYERYPAPQARYDDGASAPQVLDQPQPGYTTDKPVDAYYPHPGAETQGQALKPVQKKVLGIPSTTFWIATGFAVLVVLGIALGAGLGVGLSNKGQSQTSPSTPATSASSLAPSDTTTAPPTPTKSTTASTTSSAFVTSGTTGLAANSCNFTTPKTYYAPDGTGFTEYCFTDWPNREAAADGVGNVTDLRAATVYTFEDCMQKCLDYNESFVSGATRCTAITYNSNLTSIIAVGRQGGNCFLKNKRGVYQQGSAESASAAMAN